MMILVNLSVMMSIDEILSKYEENENKETLMKLIKEKSRKSLKHKDRWGNRRCEGCLTKLDIRINIFLDIK